MWPVLSTYFFCLLIVRPLILATLFVQGFIPNLLGRAFKGVSITSRPGDPDCERGSDRSRGSCEGCIWGLLGGLLPERCSSLHWHQGSPSRAGEPSPQRHPGLVGWIQEEVLHRGRGHVGGSDIAGIGRFRRGRAGFGWVGNASPIPAYIGHYRVGGHKTCLSVCFSCLFFPFFLLFVCLRGI